VFARPINYIAAYPDNSCKLTSEAIIQTAVELADHSEQITINELKKSFSHGGSLIANKVINFEVEKGIEEQLILEE